MSPTYSNGLSIPSMRSPYQNSFVGSGLFARVAWLQRLSPCNQHQDNGKYAKKTGGAESAWLALLALLNSVELISRNLICWAVCASPAKHTVLFIVTVWPNMFSIAEAKQTEEGMQILEAEKTWVSLLTEYSSSLVFWPCSSYPWEDVSPPKETLVMGTKGKYPVSLSTLRLAVVLGFSMIAEIIIDPSRLVQSSL